MLGLLSCTSVGRLAPQNHWPPRCGLITGLYGCLLLRLAAPPRPHRRFRGGGSRPGDEIAPVPATLAGTDPPDCRGKRHRSRIGAERPLSPVRLLNPAVGAPEILHLPGGEFVWLAHGGHHLQSGCSHHGSFGKKDYSLFDLSGSARDISLDTMPRSGTRSAETYETDPVPDALGEGGAPRPGLSPGRPAQRRGAGYPVRSVRLRPCFPLPGSQRLRPVSIRWPRRQRWPRCAAWKKYARVWQDALATHQAWRLPVAEVRASDFADPGAVCALVGPLSGGSAGA